jgi:hypothetical protein
MARFYGVLQGQAGTATRLGSPRSGITVEGRGWDAGVKVHGYVNDMTGGDEFDIYMTGGSNGATPSRHLGTIRFNDEGEPIFHLTNRFKVEMDGADPVVTV